MRVCVDVSAAYLSSGRSGIPRIVRKFVETLAARDGAELMCFAFSGDDFREVAFDDLLGDSTLARSKSAARNVLMLPPLRTPLARGVASVAWRMLSAGATFTKRTARFGPNDAILLPERAQSATAYRCFKERKGGATLISIAHDLFAITYARDPQDAKKIAAHYRTEFDLADGIISGSRTAADDVRRFLGDGARDKPILFNYWGADFAGEPAGKARKRADGRPVVLSVGALEPRKNYPFALDICSRLWAQGADFSYRIVGAKGWLTMDFLAEMKRHPEFERRLFFHDAPDDAFLMSLYRGSDILLSTSFDEGFGLPLMEASALGLGVVCSDIPVYREICGSTARFVPLDDAAGAAKMLGVAIRETCAPRRDAPPGLKSWEASMAALCAQIEEIRQLKAG